MAFQDVVFPDEISYGSKGGPAFLTTIITLASGVERRNAEWTRVRSQYDVSHGIKDPEQLEALRNFFYTSRGRAHSFKFKDWGDFEISQQGIGVGDGTKVAFQIIKSYIFDSFQYDRELTKIEPGSVLPITVNGVPYSEGASGALGYQINYNTGIVTFNVAPANGSLVVIPYARFYVHARFDIDVFDPVHDFWRYQSWQSIPIVEIKGAV